MKEEKLSKCRLLMKRPEDMTMEECNKELSALFIEFMSLDQSCDKIKDTYPLIKEMIMSRFNQIHNRVCYLNSKKNYTRPTITLGETATDLHNQEAQQQITYQLGRTFFHPGQT